MKATRTCRSGQQLETHARGSPCLRDRIAPRSRTYPDITTKKKPTKWFLKNSAIHTQKPNIIMIRETSSIN